MTVLGAIDTLTAKLQSLGREVAAMPARLDAIEAAKAAGVKAPEGGTWRTLDELDASLNSAFAPDGRPLDSVQMDKRVKLKNAILASGLCAETERPRPANEGAIRYAVMLMKRHNIKLPADNKMFLPGDISAMAISPEVKIELKVALEKAGLLDTTDTIVKASAPTKPNTAAAELIFAELEIAPQKLHVNALSALMRQRGVETTRRMQIKETLGACGYLIF
jgi:hypothetical protein